MESKNKLPKYWVVKNDSSADWIKAVSYVSEKSGHIWLDTWSYLGFDGSCGSSGYDGNHTIELFKNNPVVLTVSQFISLTEEWELIVGEMIQVSHFENRLSAITREFIYKSKDGYVVRTQQNDYVEFKYAWPIPKTKEVTFSEVAQAFNTTVDLLKIKGYVNEQDAIEDVKNLCKTYVRTGIIKDMPSTPLIASYAGKNIITVSKDGKMEIDIPSIHSIINKP